MRWLERLIAWLHRRPAQPPAPPAPEYLRMIEARIERAHKLEERAETVESEVARLWRERAMLRRNFSPHDEERES